MKKIMDLKGRFTDSLVLFIGSLPIFWAIGIVLFAIRARIYLGYWPAPNHPDPQVLPFDVHDWILFVATHAVFFSLLILPVLRRLLSDKIKWSVWHWTKRIFVSGWALILILTIVPTINFAVWYLD